MRNGKILDMKKEAIRKALTETNINWAESARLLGMSANGVSLFAKRHRLVRRGQKLGEKRWVLA